MNKQEFGSLIFGDDPAKIKSWFQLFKDPIWTPKEHLPLDEQRELTYKRLQQISKSGIVSVLDFNTDPKNIFTAHELISTMDGSAVTKFTVQYNLFGGSILALHNNKHNDIFKKIDNLDVIGCFCLTELGYGNNAVMMETTVTYEEKTQEFVVNSPTPLSWKYWITNGACHANYALVFGQTIVKGKNEGVNAFLVRVRDDQGKVMPGVTIVDMGWKIGVNGVDNAGLAFDHVRIPRTNMMTKFADVSPEGQFICDVKKNYERFFKVTERLLSGRICIASLSISSARTCLYITVKYAKQRLCVGRSGLSDTPIFDYQLFQNAMMPLMARTICLNLSHNAIKDIFANQKGHEHDILLLCCVDKTMISWNSEKLATVARERCGGQGYLDRSKFGEIITGAHSAMTAEGDNRVLMLKVVKDLMTNVFMGHSSLPELKMCPKTQLPNVDDISKLEVLHDLLKIREVTMFNTLTERMGAQPDKFALLFYEASDLIQGLAMAFGERVTFEHSLQQMEKTSGVNKEVVGKLIRLYALDVVLGDLGFFLTEGLISNKNAKNASFIKDQLVKEVAVHALDIVESFPIPEEFKAPITGDYVTHETSLPRL